MLEIRLQMKIMAVMNAQSIKFEQIVVPMLQMCIVRYRLQQ